MAKEIIEVAKSLGSIKSIEVGNNDIPGKMLEIWITNLSGECNMYGLFDYTGGVIEV